MDAEAAVHGRTVDANEHAIGDRRPGGIFGVAVEAGLCERV